MVGRADSSSSSAESNASVAGPGAAEAAREAGLFYVSCEGPGVRRRRHGKGFSYTGPDGTTLRDPEILQRIRDLAIPPAWRDVWICPDPTGHLQATGRDDRGRKQYIYHAVWARIRGEAKFSRMAAFAEALPDVRGRVEHDLRLRKLGRDKVLAAVIGLLDHTLIRVGNDAYVRSNRSFGLTTLRDRHVWFEGDTCTFVFRGKSGKDHTVTLADRRLARVVRRCREVPGFNLFQYFTDEGERQTVTSSDVNLWLRETTGSDFSAKDFRTWGGSVGAAEALQALSPATSEREADRNLRKVVKHVALYLGNTPAVCRQYYIHPALFDAYLIGDFQSRWSDAAALPAVPLLRPSESALLHFLRRT